MDSKSDTDYVSNLNLVDANFVFYGGKVFYRYFPPDYRYFPPGNNGWDVEKTTPTLYCMDNISYDKLMYQAIQFFMKYHIEESEYKDDLSFLKITTPHYLWQPLSQLLLYTRYSFFVKNLIEEKKYMEKFQVQWMSCCYRKLLKTKEYGQLYTVFFSEKVVSPKDRLLNLLYFSTLSKDKTERLVDNFFKTNSFQEIISYYETALSDTADW